MDLGTVKRKLERKQYANAKECAEDIRLIWNNCKTYNMEESDFYLLADNFSKRFEERYKKIKAECMFLILVHGVWLDRTHFNIISLPFSTLKLIPEMKMESLQVNLEIAQASQLM